MEPAFEPAGPDADATPGRTDGTLTPADLYAPPREEQPTKQRRRRRRHYTDASHGARLVNHLIDYLAIVLLSAIVGAMLVVAGAGELVTAGPTSYLFWALMYAGYYLVAEGMSGRTVGKLLTGTTVITEDGRTPSFEAILWRSLIRLVPLEPLSFLTSMPTGWHDRWSKTRVVRLGHRRVRGSARKQKRSALLLGVVVGIPLLLVLGTVGLMVSGASWLGAEATRLMRAHPTAIEHLGDVRGCSVSWSEPMVEDSENYVQYYCQGAKANAHLLLHTEATGPDGREELIDGTLVLTSGERIALTP